MNFSRAPNIFRCLGRLEGRLYCFNASVSAEKPADKSHIDFYMKIFRLSATNTSELLNKYPCLYSGAVDLKDIKSSADYLLSRNYSANEIKKFPTSLLLNRLTFENRTKVLNECCFTEVQLLFLHRFVSVMNKSILLLKAHGYIENDIKVAEHLVKFLDVPIVPTKELNDSISLKITRKIIISLYLKKRLGMTDQDLVKLWKTYVRLTNKSLESIVHVLDVLQNKVGLTSDKIIRNGFLVHGCGENITKMLEYTPSIAGVPMKEILAKSPKIAMQNAETVQETLNHITDFGIPEDRVLRCEEILTLGSDTIHERLIEVKSIDEFSVLFSNPGILKLLHHKNKAISRLEYLKQLKVKCMSLNVLSHASCTFEKYAKSGKDRTKGYELLSYLSERLYLKKEIVRDILNRHPNWCFVPIISVKTSTDYLHSRGFKDQDLKDNLYILLYPVSRIDQKLNSLIELKEKDGENHWVAGEPLSTLSESKLLSLCLYFIEAEFHFTGNGIWEIDRSDVGKQDIASTTIPEFPDSSTKDYRYGPMKRKSEKVLMHNS